MMFSDKKRGSRHYQVLLVPDQEGEPRNWVLSTAQIRLLIGVVVLLILHVLGGLIGYFYIGSLRSERHTLQTTVSDLQARNKKIETIVAEFERVRLLDYKIRKAYGSSLGLQEQMPEEWSQLASSLDSITQSPSRDSAVRNAVPMESEERSREGFYFLAERTSGYAGPEFLPTLLPVGGYLTTHFQKSGWYTGRSHVGIDIAAKKGATIRAAGSGVVLFSDWTPDLGKLIILAHGNGLYSYYGHAMRLLVDQGQSVRKGQSIALIGSSGISSAPHLHFEIWKDGEPVDPEDYLFAARRQEEQPGS